MEKEQNQYLEKLHLFWKYITQSKIRKILLGLFTITFLGVLFIIWKVATYSLPIDLSHLDYKKQYLQQITQQQHNPTTLPNIIFILFDDLGYGDIGVYGSKSIRTPNMDKIASQGIHLTHFYAPSPICSPSRAGFMTGRYPLRTGVEFVLYPNSSPMTKFRKVQGRHSGLPSEEIVIADILKAAGYKTAIVGKWHLGDQTPATPNEFGFDHFYGAYCSNDMNPMHLYQNSDIIAHHPVDQTTLTKNYTKSAIKFIQENRKQPFFLYMPHTFPHLPLYSSKQQQGKSMAGKYGDVVEDLDHSVGQIADTLARLGLEKNTLLIISSDNGPWYQGNPGGARGRKFEVFEGGVRVPFIARWPGKIPENTISHNTAMGIDLLPTFLAILNASLPKDRIIDGQNILPLLTKKVQQKRQLYFYWKSDLYAMRQDNFKYHRRHRVGEFNPAYPIPWNIRKGPWLFDLSLDSSESYDVLEKYPDIAKSLRQQIDKWDQEVKSNPRGWVKK